jgi:DNA replication and repair protein RecF
MPLNSLELAHFRCVESATINFDQRCTLITGANGSGKTSILEAIYLLGSGRSFRTHQTELLVQRGQERLMAVARTTAVGADNVLGLELSRNDRRLRVNGANASGIAQMAQLLPVQVIDPSLHRLMEEGPSGRRRFIDWGVFHVEPTFQSTWRSFRRALEQRNATLKSQKFSALPVWTHELAIHGQIVAALRENYVEGLKPFIKQLGHELLDADVDIEHQQGWAEGTPLEEALQHTLMRDQLRGVTGVGPHRAELLVKLGEISARDRISRGQQKMLACVLILAQQRHLASLSHAPACLLLDDPAAELDVDNFSKLLHSVVKTPAQLVVTSLVKHGLEHINPGRMFHVEHGNIAEVA